MVRLAATEDTVHGLIDYADQPVVQLSGHAVVSARNGLDQLRVRNGRRCGGLGDGSEPRAGEGTTSHGISNETVTSGGFGKAGKMPEERAGRKTRMEAVDRFEQS